MPSSYILC